MECQKVDGLVELKGRTKAYLMADTMDSFEVELLEALLVVGKAAY
jgi:hypothetical protein